jgi:NTP pyrophosphatase (non-canonical NTP hydrolase)
MTDIEQIDDLLVRMSKHIDEMIGDTPDRTWARVVKVGEEVGEVFEALVMAHGGHRRKDGLTMDDVAKELLDVAGAAMMAWVHLHGNNSGEIIPAFLKGLQFVVERVGA